MKKLLLLAIVVLGFCAVSFGQTTASVNGSTATAAILTPITLNKTNDLAFGTIGAQAGASKVVMKTDGTWDATSTATFYNLASTPPSVPTFTVGGTPDASFIISLPSDPTTLNGPSGGTMTITDWVSSIGTTSALDATGAKVFVLTCTLNVKATASQPAGQYTGTYDVKVDYNQYYNKYKKDAII